MEEAALFRGVFDAVPDAVVVVDGAGSIVLANAQCRDVFGREAATLVGQSIEVLVPERFRLGHPRRRDGYRAEPNPRPMGLLRLAARRADGSEFPAEISLAPIAVDGASYVSATVRDITARIREEERFRNLLEAAPDPTIIVDDTATIVLANDQMENVFGYDRADLVGRSVAVLASTPGPDEVLERVRRYLLDPDLVPMGYTGEFRIRHRHEYEVPVEIGLSPLHTDEGVLVSVAIRDMTEHRRLEAESQRQRDELIATVSHELRTPLTSIIGYAELMADLDEGDLSRRARRLLGVIERNAARELQLVDDLLTMAYLDDNRLRIERRPILLIDVARQVVDDAALRARQRGIELALVEAEVPPVHGDAYRLAQVLENLLTNALKFTGPGGRVDVVVRDDGPRGVLEVRDTGIGVSPEEKEHVFDRLYRTPSAVRSQVQGAGLGLSIVRAIVDAHGGLVEVDSEVGVGTTVRVSIPHQPPTAG
ncbi:PAS domain S-box protein [Nocardioides aquiterrae]|uniref:Sensor-like histidine kinase SenX3 n=1 Tax=Nocardioides aquiterrae TaxID=203799 RepID=A0ABP4EUD6_9ACTN